MPPKKDNKAMDFIKIIRILSSHFTARNIPYMVVGGVALGIWGIQRATKDLDFMIRNLDKPTVDSIMKGEGYTLFNEAGGFVQYEHFLVVYGLVDYLLSRSPIGEAMINRAVEKDLGEDIGTIRVATPEDIFILKMLPNSAKRPLDRQDLLDIRDFYRDRLDWSYIREYAKLLKLEEVLDSVIKV